MVFRHMGWYHFVSDVNLLVIRPTAHLRQLKPMSTSAVPNNSFQDMHKPISIIYQRQQKLEVNIHRIRRQLKAAMK